MDGENNGKPYQTWDDLGVPLFLETPKWPFYSFINGGDVTNYLQVLG